jgi:hypothetical protein
MEWRLCAVVWHQLRYERGVKQWNLSLSLLVGGWVHLQTMKSPPDSGAIGCPPSLIAMITPRRIAEVDEMK